MRWLFVAALALGRAALVEAQVGVTICACQPTSYTFTLELSQTCADSNVKGTTGVTNAVCLINTLGENVTDVVPVIIDSVTVIEVDQDDEVIGQQNWNNVSLPTGNSFQYQSVLDTMPQDLNETTIPTGIQLFLRGRNALDQQLVNILAIVYDNNCSVTAEVTDGQKLGWTVLVSVVSMHENSNGSIRSLSSILTLFQYATPTYCGQSQLGSPNRLVCPLVTAAPTQLVTVPPTSTPTNTPTQLPLTPAPSTAAPVTEPPSPATASPTAEAPPTTNPTRLPETMPPSQPPQKSGAPNLPPITPEPIPTKTYAPTPATNTDAPTPAIVPTCRPTGKGTQPNKHSKKMSRPSKSKRSSKMSKATNPLKGMSDKSTKMGEYYGSMKKSLKNRELRQLMIGAMTSQPTAKPTATTSSPTACPEDTINTAALQQFHRSLEFANERMYLMTRTVSRRLQQRNQRRIPSVASDSQ